MDFQDLIKSRGQEAAQSKQQKNIHSQLHALIDQMRTQFGEVATKGPGSFSFYLGTLKRVPIEIIHKWLGEIAESEKISTPEAKRKIFWYKFSEFSKKRNKQELKS